MPSLMDLSFPEPPLESVGRRNFQFVDRLLANMWGLNIQPNEDECHNAIAHYEVRADPTVLAYLTLLWTTLWSV